MIGCSRLRGLGLFHSAKRYLAVEQQAWYLVVKCDLHAVELAVDMISLHSTHIEQIRGIVSVSEFKEGGITAGVLMCVLFESIPLQ